MTELLCWIDGVVRPAESVSMSLASDASLRGISVFEGIKAYRAPHQDRYCVVSLHSHIQRLQVSCELMRLRVDSLADRVNEGISALLKAETRSEVYIRPTVYLRSGYYGTVADADLVVLARSAADHRAPLRCSIATQRHVPASAYPWGAKVGAMYAFFRLARLEAVERGADEAILLSTDGRVAETPGASIFVVRAERISTPRLEMGILPSITRLTAIEILQRRMNIEVIEEDLAPRDLCAADEVFVTGTLDEVRGVLSIDGQSIGSGETPVTNALLTTYLAACRVGDPTPPVGSAFFPGHPS
ncbi:aminotransferase class IV [Rhodopseudomonas palustris]|uniref:Probable branched-chain-amino-acid aminotransferase n=1 Tax=Rhodopseudomonas palustris (strain BisB18) TaxID=316056 RepID=Q21D29_RHOPB